MLWGVCFCLLTFSAQVLALRDWSRLGDGVRARRLHLHAVDDATHLCELSTFVIQLLLRVMMPGRPQALGLGHQCGEGRVASLQSERRIARAEPCFVEVVRLGGQRRPSLDERLGNLSTASSTPSRPRSGRGGGLDDHAALAPRLTRTAPRHRRVIEINLAQPRELGHAPRQRCVEHRDLVFLERPALAADDRLGVLLIFHGRQGHGALGADPLKGDLHG